jgi:hypothetical protein
VLVVLSAELGTAEVERPGGAGRHASAISIPVSSGRCPGFPSVLAASSLSSAGSLMQ